MPFVQMCPVRPYAHCLPLMVDPEAKMAAVMMSRPRHCYAISTRYFADNEKDRPTTYSAFDHSLIGEDLAAGDAEPFASGWRSPPWMTRCRSRSSFIGHFWLVVSFRQKRPIERKRLRHLAVQGGDRQPNTSGSHIPRRHIIAEQRMIEGAIGRRPIGVVLGEVTRAEGIAVPRARHHHRRHLGLRIDHQRQTMRVAAHRAHLDERHAPFLTLPSAVNAALGRIGIAGKTSTAPRKTSLTVGKITS